MCGIVAYYSSGEEKLSKLIIKNDNMTIDELWQLAIKSSCRFSNGRLEKIELIPLA